MCGYLNLYISGNRGNRVLFSLRGGGLQKNLKTFKNGGKGESPSQKNAHQPIIILAVVYGRWWRGDKTLQVGMGELYHYHTMLNSRGQASGRSEDKQVGVQASFSAPISFSKGTCHGEE